MKKSVYILSAAALIGSLVTTALAQSVLLSEEELERERAATEDLNARELGKAGLSQQTQPPQRIDPSRLRQVDPNRTLQIDPKALQRPDMVLEIERKGMRSREEISSLVAEVTPKFSPRAIMETDNASWQKEFDPRRFAEAVDDPELSEALEKVPDEARANGTYVVTTPSSRLRVDLRLGRVRYDNRKRTFSPEMLGKPVPDEKSAVNRAMPVFEAFALSSSDMKLIRQNVQAMAFGRPESEKPEMTAEVYALTSLDRRLGDLPVLGSNSMVALNPNGEVQRAGINWPSVTSRGDKVMSPSDVSKRAVEALIAEGVPRNAAVDARLAFVPSADGGDLILPSVIYTIEAQPTPYVVSVPIVMGSGDDD